MEYENDLRVVIEHLIGWDEANCKNKRDEGLFGDVDALAN
jgi:hypothetical protein